MCQRIKLSQGKFALVSDEDFERVNKFKWCYDKGYAVHNAYIKHPDGTATRKKIMLHRFIMNTPDGMECDHKDRTAKLDCRRENLRNATRHQNNANNGPKSTKTSCSYKGAYWHKTDKRWYSEIQVHGKRIYLGTFPTAEDAARAYDLQAVRYWGQFACLNFPELAHVYRLTLASITARVVASPN